MSRLPPLRMLLPPLQEEAAILKVTRPLFRRTGSGCLASCGQTLVFCFLFLLFFLSSDDSFALHVEKFLKSTIRTKKATDLGACLETAVGLFLLITETKSRLMNIFYH